MQENPLWNLLTRTASFFAVLLLLLGAGLIVASYFEWTENQIAGVLTVFFGAVLGVFSLITINFSNLKLNHELKIATEIAHQISQGEMLEEDFEGGSEMFDSLKDMSDYLRAKAAISDRIATGDLSEDIVLCSDSDDFGRSFQNMMEKLRLFVETEEKRNALQKSILKLSREVSEDRGGRSDGRGGIGRGNDRRNCRSSQLDDRRTALAYQTGQGRNFSGQHIRQRHQ